AAAPTPIFRDEAIAHQRARGLHAEVLQVDTGATRMGFPLSCAAAVVLLVFLTLGRLNEYASGPAFIQLEGRTALSASLVGLVTDVLVKPGDRVEAGDVLVRFHASDEDAELLAASDEFENQLTKLLLRPSDPTTREALVSLRTRSKLAQQHAEQRTLRAPHAGFVGDVRVREAQLVEPGMRVLDLQDSSATATLVALLPGRYRPLLHAGHRMRFEVDGFQQRAHEFVVSRVGDQILGPGEAARYLGRDLGDAISIGGPVVVVEAALPSTSFEADGQRYEFSSGMFGQAEAVVRDEPVAYAFVPGLRPWVERVQTLAPVRALVAWVKHVH
ncbi:MAG TPA: HlyD family efflux transporter periplasmic adaptor subunit, partial [Polyangiales bacterium]|nr:HlyD family efflux transporter periplasmic adaptor subunit [Polyangiales bacterium]